MQDIVNDAFFCDPKNEKDVVCLINTLIAVLGDSGYRDGLEAAGLKDEANYLSNFLKIDIDK